MSEHEHEHQQRSDFRIGPFTIGDLIALGSVVFTAGALWWRVASLERMDEQQHEEHSRLVIRMERIEQALPDNYVRRDQYREDVRELKDAVLRIEAKIDAAKVDLDAHK